ncbi:short-chain fatty acid transporter [uncultured Flavonifractor sp.]|uniref:short-chain fatty acid transporter n=1 Tax=uncultured Flavonifractor sp. TaxID=1193534 RepID=UPI0026301879|nr:short-chain fatty acid transporter [uncultured Flavonifractor sp.]
MFKKFTNGCVRVVNRWLPDPFLFAIILTIVVFIAAMIGTQQGPLDLIWAWGGQGKTESGFWSLLAFAMQMALVLVLGSAMASAKVCKRILGAIASLAHNKRSAILITTFVSTICCWLNWGFGLIAGALLAREVAKRVKDVDYPLLIAAAYSGFVIWHAGLSGSIPLQIGAEGGTEILGISYFAPTSATIFHPVNLLMVGVILVLMPFVNYAMHPDADHTIVVDPTLLVDEEERTYKVETPADKIEHSRILWVITLVLGFIYIVYYFVQKGFNLDLNIVNMIFLFLGILLHGDLRKYVDAIGDAAAGAAGILLQFPFYAGIMGLMVAANPDTGVSLASIIANFFTNISNDVTFPVLTFLSAGIINFFVPSGGGQWAVQAPIVMPAATQMGIEYGRAAMAIAWGDQWTNMIQPFWALPALGIAGLSARNIMGYLVIVTIFTGVVACGGFLLWGLFF